MRGDQPADGLRRVGDDDEQASLPLLGEVEGGLEEDAGQRRDSPPRRSQRANFDSESRTRQRPWAKTKACTPPAKTLISWFGLSTRQTWPRRLVAIA